VPFFIDVIVIYVVRVLLRATKLLRGWNWPVSAATVMSAVTEGKSGQIYYQYFVDGQNYADVDEKPFLLPGQADSYVRKFRRGDLLKVRVKPGNPSVSVPYL
jgi:hypothetical protein